MVQESLLQAQKELDALGQELAHEKMARASAEADLDAVKSKKPDTSEADSLRKELQDLKDQHRASLVAAQQQVEIAADEHNATTASLKQAMAQLEEHNATNASLKQAMAQLEEHKNKFEAQLQTSKDDYITMHSSLTELAEEAHKQVADLEARLFEAQAQLKVKEAELAEAEVCIAHLIVCLGC
jgi:chromosome segregation ATPase